MNTPHTFFLMLCLLFGNLIDSQAQIVNLTTEYTPTPLGIDVSHPRFGWQMESERRGAYQSAYQLIVHDEKGFEVWNTRKTNNNTAANITYSGQGLVPRTRYTWQVSVWDEKGKKQSASSWFETGLMKDDPGLSAWHGAQWIGGSDKDLALYSQYLPVFEVSFSLQLEKVSRSTRAGFIYGANDSRLMDKDKNLYGLHNAKDSAYILVELDIAPLASNKAALLNVYRVGYCPTDYKQTPLKSFSIPASVINKNNQFEKHTFSLSSVFGDTHLYIDGKKEQNLVGRVNLNPLGQGGDFIAFPVAGDIGFSLPKGQTANFSDVAIRNYRSPSSILFKENINDTDNHKSIFSDKNIKVISSSYHIEGGKSGSLITANPSHNAMPMLRSTFSVSDRRITKARLYVTSRGIYDVYINGRRIGNDYFNPGLTQYNKTQLYQTYDITSDLQAGKNAIGAMLAEGWWSGGATYTGDFWNFFGDRQSLLAQLVISYADGKENVLVTNSDTWKYFNDGPVAYGSLFQGEVYDATKESNIKGWSTHAYDDVAWGKAVSVSLENHISTDTKNKDHNMAMANDYTQLRLTGQYGPTVKQVRRLTAIAVEKVRPDVYVYDMGQNMAGVPRIELNGLKPGSRVTLRFAEVKYPDLPEYKEHSGSLMMENIRAAMAQDIYIARGGKETISPRFTYHGYRYVEITGIDEPLPLADVKGDVLSSVHEFASGYETSSAEINKLWENTTWSTLANFMSIPTDCPQRNERLGWSGDISVFSRTATYLANIPQFLRRHMQAMRDVQREDGRFTDVAPLGGGFGGVLWGSAGITVAWENYQQYGDKDMLAEHYDAMSRYIDFLIGSIDTKTGVLNDKERDQWASLGDWLSPEYDRSEKALLWEAYFIYDLEIMAKMAIVLGKEAQSKKFNQLHTQRKAFFNKTYVDTDGTTIFRGKKIDTQCSYVLPLQFNIFNEEIKLSAAKNLANTVSRQNRSDDGHVHPPYSLMTGFIGTAWINSALSDNGYSESAYRLLQQTSYPSWLYPVSQGATTIWERLNSYTHTNGFGGNNRMNSFNHYSFGAIGAWMYTHSLGIQRDENSPGFQHFILKPEPDPTGKMKFAKGFYNSLYGQIKSSWKIIGSTFEYNFSVPANTTATLYIAAESLSKITEGRRPLEKSKGVKYLDKRDGKFVFELSSGDYNISAIK